MASDDDDFDNTYFLINDTFYYVRGTRRFHLKHKLRLRTVSAKSQHVRLPFQHLYRKFSHRFSTVL